MIAVVTAGVKCNIGEYESMGQPEKTRRITWPSSRKERLLILNTNSAPTPFALVSTTILWANCPDSKFTNPVLERRF